jgi:hypothetical protein
MPGRFQQRRLRRRDGDAVSLDPASRWCCRPGAMRATVSWRHCRPRPDVMAALSASAWRNIMTLTASARRGVVMATLSDSARRRDSDAVGPARPGVTATLSASPGIAMASLRCPALCWRRCRPGPASRWRCRPGAVQATVSWRRCPPRPDVMVAAVGLRLCPASPLSASAMRCALATLSALRHDGDYVGLASVPRRASARHHASASPWRHVVVGPGVTSPVWPQCCIVTTHE